MAALADDDSFSFRPSDERLLDHYPSAKLNGKFSDLTNAAYFLDADVCSARPQDLVHAHRKPARVPTRDAGDGQQWYFFSPVRFLASSLKKKSRTIVGTGGKESCHAEGRPKPVERSACGGYVQKFSYHVRIGPRIVEKPGWIVVEYSFKDIRDGDTFLCKVYRSPRGPGGSIKSGCKRKAADDLEAATPRTRQRQIDEEFEYHAAAQEFGETHNVEESLPEPQFVQASVDGDITLKELQRLMMAEEEKDRMTLQVPDGEDPEAYYVGVLFGNNEQQDVAVQT